VKTITKGCLVIANCFKKFAQLDIFDEKIVFFHDHWVLVVFAH
jgi:hypothetical protein